MFLYLLGGASERYRGQGEAQSGGALRGEGYREAAGSYGYITENETILRHRYKNCTALHAYFVTKTHHVCCWIIAKKLYCNMHIVYY